ncbi:TBC1 domain family member 7 [Diorhabda sublineata]|uniref:TBC1 domain family member 7 n=1 Tax=Diorhabda sublineata TaxID=1163346 RepID=UPI0024E10341|nr:TBC1 domain family member 7 [Diorhabda sublineata]
MGDERNFRSAYYEKVGFRSVEEKKSLEILLKEKPLDCEKLKQFCLRYCVPTCYRNLVWKLLLGIIPVHMDSHNFVIEQRKQEYQELYRALTVMRIIDSNTPKPQVISAMCSLRSGNFAIDSNIVTTRPFDCIVYAFMEYSDDDADIFWMFKNFWESVQKFHPELDKLVEKTFFILEKEDPAYYRIIKKNDLFKNLPVDMWIDCCFAGVLKDMFVEKIWDKFLGGSYLIFVFASVMLLMTLRGRITNCTSLAATHEFVKCLPDETAGIITNKAIELWQNYGSPLTLHDKLKP